MSLSLDASIRPRPLECKYDENLAIYNSIAKAYAGIPDTLKDISNIFKTYNKLLAIHEQNRKKLEEIEPDLATNFLESSILKQFDCSQVETEINKNIKALSEKTKALPKVINRDVKNVGTQRSLLLIETADYIKNVFKNFKEVLDALNCNTEYLSTEIETQNAFLG